MWAVGCGGRHPAGPRGAVGQHEDTGPQRQPQAPEFRQQSHPEEKEAAGVRPCCHVAACCLVLFIRFVCTFVPHLFLFILLHYEKTFCIIAVFFLAFYRAPVTWFQRLWWGWGIQLSPFCRLSLCLRLLPFAVRSTKPRDGFFIHDPENGGEDSNVALEKLRDVIAQCILPQAGEKRATMCPCHGHTQAHTHMQALTEGLCFFTVGENEDEKLNEVMHEAWRFNRDCKLLRDGLQGLNWDGKCTSP